MVTAKLTVSNQNIFMKRVNRDISSATLIQLQNPVKCTNFASIFSSER